MEAFMAFLCLEVMLCTFLNLGIFKFMLSLKSIILSISHIDCKDSLYIQESADVNAHHTPQHPSPLSIPHAAQ